MTTLDWAQLAVLSRRNRIEFSRWLARCGGDAGAIFESDGHVFCAAGSTFPATVNAAWRTDPTLAADEFLDRADEWFDQRRRGYTVSVRSGFDDDVDLSAAAQARGLAALMGSPEMVCSKRLDDGHQPDGVELRWVTDRSGLEAFATVNDTAYQSLGMTAGVVHETFRDLDEFIAPQSHAVVGYDGDRPLAAAQTLVAGGIAGVYWVGVVDEARGRGLGEAVTRAVTNRAFDLGASACVLQASKIGELIYARLGYEVVYRNTGLIRLGPTGT